MKKVIPKDAVLIPEAAQKVFQGEIFSLYQWKQTMFDGSSATFEMLARPDTVQVICADNDKILLLEEQQPHGGKRLNFAGGRVDKSDETTLMTAQREVLEETGLTFKRWKLIGVMQPQVKNEWFIYTYLATIKDTETRQNLDAGEKITLQWRTFDEVKTLTLAGHRHLDESEHIFKNAASYQNLLDCPEYQGVAVDR